MKAKMYSAPSNSQLHDHIIDGFHTTHEGLRKLKEEKLIKEEEYTSLLEQNINRLVNRIHEFRIREGLVQASKRLTCIFFALLFAFMQINSDDSEMCRTGRSSRTRTGRSARSRTGRRKGDIDEPEPIEDPHLETEFFNLDETYNQKQA